MSAHNEQSSVVEKVAEEMREFYDAEMAPDDDVLKSWIDRLAAQPSPVVKQNLTTQPAAAQEAVASVRDLLPQEVISAISAVAVIASKESPHPVQKHIDTINSWLYAAPVTAAPAHPRALTASIARLDAFLGGECAELLTPAQSEAAALVLQELKRRMASTPAAPGIDLYPIRCALQYAAAAARENTHTEMAEGFDALIRKIDASPKGGSEAWQPIETAPKDARWLILGIAGRNEIMLGYWSRLHQGWWGQTCANGEFKLWQRATHWMPMPNVPTQAGDAEVQP